MMAVVQAATFAGDHVLKLPSIGRKTKAVSSTEMPYLEKIQSEKCVTKLLSRNS
jgi:hypothetical protein